MASPKVAIQLLPDMLHLIHSLPSKKLIPMRGRGKRKKIPQTFHVIKCIKKCQREQVNKISLHFLALFLPPPPPPPPHTSFNICVTSGFTRFSMKTKYVCRGFNSPYVNFHYNRTMWSTNLHVQNCRWGGKEKEPISCMRNAVRTIFEELYFEVLRGERETGILETGKGNSIHFV